MIAEVERVPSVESFAADWVGRYVVGRSFVLWCWDASFGGSVFWGVPDLDDVRGIASIYALAGDTGKSPTQLISDASRLESLAPEALTALLPSVRHSAERNDARIRRHGYVVPAGIWGVVVAGVLPFVDADHPWRLFADPAAAYTYVEHADAAAARDEVEAIVEAARAQPPAIRALRGFLGEHLAAATLGASAQALAMSPRALQRELARGGTSFQHELDQARVRAAIDLVNLTDEKLEAIAAQVGLSSVSKLNDVFRRVTRVTPGQLRARRGG
jgi:AraC-like DNA-binding protein